MHDVIRSCYLAIEGIQILTRHVQTGIIWDNRECSETFIKYKLQIKATKVENIPA